MPDLRFIITTDSAGAVTGVMRYREALSGLGPAASSASDKTTTAFDRIEATLRKAKSAMIGFVAAVALSKVIQGFNSLIQSGIDFEASFAGIKKTVEGTTVQFEKLSEEMRQMARELPINVNELNKIGEIAGQLGIPTDKISEFTHTIAQIGVATNLTTEEAATNFARFAAIMGMPIGEVKKFASVIVDLGNKSSATEKEILEFSMNIAAAGKRVGLSEVQVAALATTLASVGLHAEKGGSAMSRILLTMATAVDENNEKLRIFADTAGMTTQAFARAFKDNAAQALVAFMAGLKSTVDRGEQVTSTLKELELSELRVNDVTVRTALAVDDLSKNLKIAGDEAAKSGQALDREFNKYLQTTQAQLGIAAGKLRDLGISLSMELLPALLAAVKGLVSLTEFLGEHETALKAAVTAVTAFGLAWVGLRLTSAITGIQGVSNALFLLTSALEGASAASAAFQLASPWLLKAGAIAAGVAALGGLAYTLWNYVDAAKAAITAEGDHNVALADHRTAVLRLVQEYAKYNINIRTEGRTLDDIENSLKILQPAYQKAIALKTAAATAADKHTNAVHKEDKAFTDQVENMLKALTKEKNETQALVAVLMQAGSAGVKWDVIVRTFGKAIQEAAEHTEGLTAVQKEVIKVANAQVEAAAKLVREQDVLDDNAKNVNKTFLSQSVLLNNMNYAYDKWQQLVRTVGADLQEYNRIMVRVNEIEKEFEERKKALNLRTQEQIDLQNTLRGMIVPAGMQLGGIGGLDPDRKHTAEEIEKAGKGVIDQITNDISRMFKNAIGHGKSFWEAFKTMGMGAIASVADIMFKDLMHGFLDQFKEKFGKWQLDFQDWIRDTLKPELSKLFKSLGSGRGIALTAAGAGIGAAVSGGSKTGTAAGALGGAALNQAVSGKWVSAAVLGIAAVGTAFIGMIHQLHKEANKFVQGIQNPFTSAVEDIFKALQLSKDMGDLTVKQVDAAKVQFESMWASFQAQAAQAGLVGQQALQTMTPFIESWRTWLDSLGDAASNMERLAKVKDITDKVTGAADGWDILEIAVQDMMDRGVDWAVIIKFLGNDIKDMADKMTALGIAIPPAIQSIVDAMDSIDALEKATRRQAEVETELAQTRDALINAYISKIDYLNAEIEKGTDAIAKWRDRIADINTEIGEQTTKLNDTEFWHKRYNDLIKDETDALKAATDARKNAQDRILDLERSVARDRLEAQLMAAQKSKKQSRIDAAEAAIDAFELQIKKKDMASRAAELAQLKRDLPALIALEKQAQASLVSASIAATEQINIEKQQIMQRILNLQGEREQLQKNINATELWIQTLEKDRTTTEKMLEAIGGKRKTEWEKINDTINSLTERGLKLEEERDALSKLTGIAKESVDAFHNLARAIQEAANIQVEPQTAAQTQIQMPTGPAPTPLFPEGPTNPGGIPTVPNGYINTDGMDIFGMLSRGGLSSFEEGTQDTGPKPLLALLHPHEAVLTREQNAGVNYSPSVVINNLTITGNNRDDMKRTVRDVIIPEILSALDTNSSQIVQKFTRKISPSQQKLINK